MFDLSSEKHSLFRSIQRKMKITTECSGDHKSRFFFSKQNNRPLKSFPARQSVLFEKICFFLLYFSFSALQCEDLLKFRCHIQNVITLGAISGQNETLQGIQSLISFVHSWRFLRLYKSFIVAGILVLFGLLNHLADYFLISQSIVAFNFVIDVDIITKKG